MKSDEPYAIGKLVGCFGIKGYLKVQLYTHSPERLKKLRSVLVGRSSAAVEPRQIEDVLFQNRATLMKFKAVDDRTAAEKMVGNILFVTEQSVARPPKGSYFIHEIVGCEVWDQHETLIGTVDDVLKVPAQDLWKIRSGEKTYLLPAVKEFIKKVEIKKRRITVEIIDGLLEEQAP